MGSDQRGEPDEHPAHAVTVRGYWLDRCEVTVSEYLECVEAERCPMYRTNAASSSNAGPDADFRHPHQPISGVSHDDAVAYCRFRDKRLPSEAEWERAARGDDARVYPWGNDPPDPARHGCFGRALGAPSAVTCDVGSFPEGKGPYGHLDLGGNVWEWTADLYDPFAYLRPTAAQGIPGDCQAILAAQEQLRREGKQGFTGTNPIPTTCEYVLRGGAFNYPGPGLRASNRVHHPGNYRIVMAGFRCARDGSPAPDGVAP